VYSVGGQLGAKVHKIGVVWTVGLIPLNAWRPPVAPTKTGQSPESRAERGTGRSLGTRKKGQPDCTVDLMLANLQMLRCG